MIKPKTVLPTVWLLIVGGISSAADTPASRPVARTVEAACPGLASGVLSFAVLAELPPETLVSCGEVRLVKKDLAAEIEKAPPDLRDSLGRNGFFLIEQMAAPKLLLAAAQKEASDSTTRPAGVTDEQIINAHLEKVVQPVKVSDDEVKEFYEQNKDMCGGAALDQIKDQLMQYVLQQKKQETAIAYIRDLGKHLPIQVDRAWTEQQAVLARDNPVDKARMSGKPSMVDFGSTGCRPCEMMAPILKTLEKKYEGKANILFIHVREQQVLAARYGVRGIPLQVFFDATGKEVFRHTGFYPQAEIEKRLENLGAK